MRMVAKRMDTRLAKRFSFLVFLNSASWNSSCMIYEYKLLIISVAHESVPDGIEMIIQDN